MKLFKQLRRDRAKARFRIMPQDEFISSRLARSGPRSGDADYQAYVNRKRVEERALNAH